MQEVLSLYQLNEFIRRVIALNFQEPVWITAEIAQANLTRGHRYFDLIEQDADGIIAQTQAVLWSGDYKKLKHALGDTLDQLLQPGTQVKIAVTVSFHERYGLKLTLVEIDAEWTFGSLELQRRKTIETLRQSGLLRANGQIPLPRVLQRLAVISSERAAGLQDFMQQLRQNPYGYAFQVTLYNTLVQGPAAESEMIRALEEISATANRYDAVVIIRGGGARLDLAVFDQLKLNQHIAKMPLPVLVGIGHDIDQTVTDLCAHTSLKTPTATAEFIIQRNGQFEAALLQISSTFSRFGRALLSSADQEIAYLGQRLKNQARHVVQNAEWQLALVAQQIPKTYDQACRNQDQLLEAYAQRLNSLAPDHVLKRGFSITKYKGKVVKAASTVPQGASVETQTFDGTFESIKQ